MDFAGGGQQLAHHIGHLRLFGGGDALKDGGGENELCALGVGCGVLELLMDELVGRWGKGDYGEEVVDAMLLEERGDGA